MALFRRFVPMLGPVDISPLIGLIALQVVGTLVISAIRG
jgi:uncharacterized protein YggT (Ycf19 family)